VGRERDVEAVLERLADSRLVTLTGPGGVGKTTLSFEVARRAGQTLADAVDEVRLVRLASLGRDADVAEGVARELGLVPSGPGEAAVSAVLAFLEPRRALLVVDNCEHVVDAAAELVERVLTASPHVRVLATSREALALPGEVQVAVHPLGEQPAVQLFAQRAAAVRPGFTLDGGTGPTVALVCRQLDGVPLAIELAAARVKALPLEEIAARLEDRFSLLTSGPRTSEARHRTLRATLDWSYELLTADEQALLRRLAVFRGGFSLDAAEQVCAFGGIRSGQVLDLLFRLVDRSLVVPDPATGRFRLLVTIRDYGHARLEEAGEVEQVRQRHLLHFTAFAQEHGSLTCSGGRGWARMSEDHANLQAALEFAVGRARHTLAVDDVEAGLRLATSMVWFWQYGVRYEGVAALTALLALPGGSPTCRALALQGLAMLHVYYPTPRSKVAARESLAMFEQLGDARSAAISRVVIAWEGQYAGDAAEARRLLEQAEPVLGDGAPPGMLALLHYVRASLDLREGAFEASIAEWRLARVQLQAAQDRILESAVLAHLGIALRATGRHGEALDALRQGVDLVRDGETPHGLAFALVHQAHTLLDLGDRREVAALLEQADEAARRGQNPRCQAWAAWGRARLALDVGDPVAALGESRWAVDLLEEREFPWALAELHAFVARAAGAAQDGAGASRDAVLANRTTPGTSRMR
jgi:predicted ATPase/tetratricopeptide (TPR) repeat protein